MTQAGQRNPQDIAALQLPSAPGSACVLLLVQPAAWPPSPHPLPACTTGNEGSVPTYPVRFDVKKYGAKGDGVAGKPLGRAPDHQRRAPGLAVQLDHGCVGMRVPHPARTALPKSLGCKPGGACGSLPINSLPFPCARADDTRAVQAALNAAGAAADLLNTYDCSTRYTRRRCQASAGRTPVSCHPCGTYCDLMYTQSFAISCLVVLHILRLTSWPPLQRPSDGWGNQGRAGVAVWLPPGQYRITQTLTIGWSNVVLRGAGVSLGLAPP